MSIRRFLFVLMLLLLVSAQTANAQNVTGQITGRVADPQGAVIGGASVRLTNDLTQQVREFLTDENGTFTFLSLVPGDYSVAVELPGFKTYQQTAIHVSAQERLNLHDIKLEIGDLTSTVTVESELARVQTTSADRIQTLGKSGRDLAALEIVEPRHGVAANIVLRNDRARIELARRVQADGHHADAVDSRDGRASIGHVRRCHG